MARNLAEAGFRQRMIDHRLYGVAVVDGDPRDEAHQLVGYIFALTTYMGALVADPERYTGPHLERQTDTLNREIVTGAFDALAHLAGLADFYISEID